MLDHDLFILRRTEKMDVIGHDHVGANQPRIGLIPSLDEPIMHSGFRKTNLAVQCADRQKCDRWTITKNIDAGRGIATSSPIIRRLDRVSPHQL